jgi:putative FmdB family regulatory protein
MVNMPIYEYICRRCGYKFELPCHFYDNDEELACPLCDEKYPEKQFSSVNTAASSCGATTYSGG